MANNWTRCAAHRHTTAPISALGLHPVAISRPAEGRRLSWPERTVTNRIGVNRLGLSSAGQLLGKVSSQTQIVYLLISTRPLV